jgi:nitrite reductase (NO-forming)
MAPVAPAAQSASAASSPVLAAVRDDPYDSAKMDYKPSAAALSNERHSGAFASGASINTQAALAPLDPSPIKEVRLDTTHKIIEIAPGVRFSAWTFGDTVPSPVIRARVGDRIKIKFSMTNRSDEPAPGIQLTAAPMMHSMDFHSATVSPQGKYRSIAPGRRSRSSSR